MIENQIKSDIENAKNNGADVDGMLEEANNIIAQAKKEAISIREKAKLDAMNVSNVKLTDFKAKIEENYTSFLTSLGEERITLEKTLASQMPQFKEGLKAKLSSI